MITYRVWAIRSRPSVRDTESGTGISPQIRALCTAVIRQHTFDDDAARAALAWLTISSRDSSEEKGPAQAGSSLWMNCLNGRLGYRTAVLLITLANASGQLHMGQCPVGRSMTSTLFSFDTSVNIGCPP